MLITILKQYLRPYRKQLFGVLALQLAATVASLFLPTLNARIIDEGVALGDIGRIWILGGLMLLGAVIQAATQISAVYFGAQTAMRFGADLRAAVYEKTLTFSEAELNQFGAPSLITRVTNDTRQVQMLVFLTCAMMVSAPIMMIGGVVMAVREDPGLSWLIGASVAVLAIIITVLVQQVTPLFAGQQIRIDTINRVLREQIVGRRVIRAFAREPYESARFETANADLTDYSTRVGVRIMTLFPSLALVMNISSVGVLFFGAGRITSGHLEVGQLTAYLAYLMLILMSVMMATMMVMMAPRAAVCADRIGAVLDTEPSITSPVQPVAETRRGEIVFAAVAFAYPDAETPVLQDISFTVAPGTTTAIIGATGSGKSTLLSLIPRQFDVTSGQVRVNGIDTREHDLEQLWSRIGLVPQRPYLFSGTVRTNLTFGRTDATDDELWTALRLAEASDFVSSFDQGLDAPIAQGGTNISGGQRQRLAIARALVKQPDIYLFDDSFSALDVATDARLRANLTTATKTAAVVIVAARVSTIMSADRIIVLESGRIVGEGRHEQLLSDCPTYAEIVTSQLEVPA